MSIRCQAKNCQSHPITKGGLCGYHDELAEDGVIFERKAPYTPCKTAAESKQRARDIAREVVAEIKARREAKR